MRNTALPYYLLFFLSGCFITSYAGDTIRLMHYNLLYYGHNTSFCDESNNFMDNKDKYLKIIIDHVQPDVFTVNEIGADVANSNRILGNVLNADSFIYHRALPSNNGSSNIVNMLFYNAAKFSLHEQDQIEQDVNNNNLERIIDVYKLYSRDYGQYLTLLVAHLKAGSTASDIDQRAAETAAIMEYLENKGEPGNYLLCGDLNAKGSSDDSFQNLIAYHNELYRFFDPVDRLGEWWMNPDFADLHTQSTHLSTDCHVGGGMDDRFDFIMANSYVMDATAGIQYIQDSYQTIGQDGGNFNSELDTVSNIAVPQQVAAALYKMSDHLPVAMDILIDYPLSISRVSEKKPEWIMMNPASERWKMKLFYQNKHQVTAEIRDLTGRLVQTAVMEHSGDHFALDQDIGFILPGYYLVTVKDNDGLFISRKLIKL